MILKRLNGLTDYAFPCFPIVNGFCNTTGDDAFTVFKRDVNGNYKDTIDLFQKLYSTNGTIPVNYQNKILIRKPNIRSGVTSNPQNVDNILAEWNINDFTSDNIDFNSLQHCLSAPLRYDSITTYPLNSGTCELLLTNLAAQSKYLCILKSDSDTLATYTFSTGEIIESTTSGDWNNVWGGNTIPKECDKVVVKKVIEFLFPRVAWQSVRSLCCKRITPLQSWTPISRN